jgi:hypothetical protein
LQIDKSTAELYNVKVANDARIHAKATQSLARL